jgi:hypothetical protein
VKFYPPICRRKLPPDYRLFCVPVKLPCLKFCQQVDYTISMDEPPRGKPSPAVSLALRWLERRLVREEIADLWSDYTLPRELASGFLGLISPLGRQLEERFMRRYTAVRNCTRFLKAVRCLNRGKREPKVRRTFGSGGIKPDFRIKNHRALARNHPNGVYRALMSPVIPGKPARFHTSYRTYGPHELLP